MEEFIDWYFKELDKNNPDFGVIISFIVFIIGCIIAAIGITILFNIYGLLIFVFSLLAMIFYIVFLKFKSQKGNNG